MTNGKMESRGCGDDIEDAGKAAEVAAFEKRERMGLASSIKPGPMRMLPHARHGARCASV